jgi:hypothetical protein
MATHDNAAGATGTPSSAGAPSAPINTIEDGVARARARKEAEIPRSDAGADPQLLMEPRHLETGAIRQGTSGADRSVSGSMKAHASEATSDKSKEAPGTHDGTSKNNDAQARQRHLQELQATLQERYLIKGSEYRFRGNEQRVAFQDHGKSLTTAHDSPAVVRALVDLAEAKGWKSLRIGPNSSAEFRKAVWVEASARGIKAIGHEPSAEDQKRLERERQARKPTAIDRFGRPPPQTHFSPRSAPSAVAELAAREAVARGVTDPAVLTKVREAAHELQAALAGKGRTAVARVVDPSTARIVPALAPSQPEHARQPRSR